MEFELPTRWQSVLNIVRLDFPDAVIAGGCLRDLIPAGLIHEGPPLDWDAIFLT